MTLLYILSIIAILFQICFVTVAVGMVQFTFQKHWKEFTNIIYMHNINLFSISIYSGRSLLSGRIGRGVHGGRQENHHIPGAHYNIDIRAIHICWPVAMVYGAMWTHRARDARSDNGQFSICEVFVGSVYWGIYNVVSQSLVGVWLFCTKLLRVFRSEYGHRLELHLISSNKPRSGCVCAFQVYYSTQTYRKRRK